MRTLLFAVLFLALVSPHHAQAIFYNDSDVIEIGDGTPPEPEEDGAVEAPGDQGGGSGGSGETPGGYIPPGSSGSGSSGGTSSGGQSGGGISGGTSSGDTSTGSPGGETDTLDEILDLLLESGAVSGSTALDAASGGASSLNANFSGTVSIQGARVREFFRGKYDLQEILQTWRSAGTLGAREYGIVAASTVLRDQNIDEILFTAEKFEITYRSRGYLLSIFPISFPVRVAIVPGAASHRVTVRLPWYRFFVREFFTAAKLTEEIENVIADAIKLGFPKDSDVKAELFNVTAAFLRDKVGTISDTVYLGIPENR